MGLLNFLKMRSLPTAPEPSPAALPETSTAQQPMTVSGRTPEQLADLDAARAELLQLAAEVGVKSLNACPRDGSRWQDDPATIRTITAVIREAHLEEHRSPEDAVPGR